jgi:hypothetical protein
MVRCSRQVRRSISPERSGATIRSGTTVFVFAIVLAWIPCPWCAAQTQNQAPTPADVDSRKVQPLDLKPGCWQVRTHTSTEIVYSPETLKKQFADIDKNTNSTPEQRAQQKKLAEDNAKAMFDMQKKGVDTNDVACTPFPFYEFGVEMYGTADPTKHCKRTIDNSGPTRHLHLSSSPDHAYGTENYDHVENDYERTYPQILNLTVTYGEAASEVVPLVGDRIRSALRIRYLADQV